MQSTTALRKTSALRKKIRVIQGGQGAGKTIAILMILINHASSNAGKEIIIASAELTKMRLTVIKDFIKVMKAFGIYSDQRFISGTLYRFPNGSFIKFIGLDKEDVGKGFRGDVFYLNEADKVNFETYREIASRFKNIYLDFNPNANFWVHDELITRDDCDFITLTFLDNEYLSSEERDEILRYFEQGYGFKFDGRPESEYPEPINKYWSNVWRVYGLGQIGMLVGAVHEDWSTIKEIPAEARLIGGGVDFGYKNASAWIAVFLWNGKRIYHQIIHESFLSNQDIADIVKLNESEDKQPYTTECSYADNAEPKSIDEIRREGINIIPCDGKTDLEEFAIKKINAEHFYVTESSTEMLVELRGFIWGTDSKGNSTGKPIQVKNHAMKAIQYFEASHGKYAGVYR